MANSLFVAGLDLGQAADYTALAIFELTETWDAERVNFLGMRYDCRHLERFALGTPYPAIVDAVRARLNGLTCPLLVDATGVGAPVVDLLRARGLPCQAVTIHAGADVVEVPGGYRVPKRDLVGALAVLLQSERLKFAAGLPEAQTLVDELLSFRVRIDPRTAHDSYASWREGTHDDLVLAVAIPTWWVEYAPVVIRRIRYLGPGLCINR